MPHLGQYTIDYDRLYIGFPHCGQNFGLPETLAPQLGQVLVWTGALAWGACATAAPQFGQNLAPTCRGEPHWAQVCALACAGGCCCCSEVPQFGQKVLEAAMREPQFGQDLLGCIPPAIPCAIWPPKA